VKFEVYYPSRPWPPCVHSGAHTGDDPGRPQDPSANRGDRYRGRHGSLPVPGEQPEYPLANEAVDVRNPAHSPQAAHQDRLGAAPHLGRLGTAVSFDNGFRPALFVSAGVSVLGSASAILARRPRAKAVDLTGAGAQQEKTTAGAAAA
jgi:hypothetical protein